MFCFSKYFWMCCRIYFKKCFSITATTATLASILFSVTIQFPIFTKLLCVVFHLKKLPLEIFLNWIYFPKYFEASFLLCLKNISSPDAWVPLLDAAILSSASICFKESEASNLLHFLFFYPALFCEANLICVDCMLYEQKVAPTTQLISSVFSFT